MRGLERVPFAVSVGVLAGALVLGIYLSFRFASELVLLATLALVALGAALVLIDYNARPLEPLAVRARPSPDALESGMSEPVLAVEEDNDFADPVIEADRIAAGEVLPEVVEEGAGGPAPPEPPNSPAAPPAPPD